MDMVATMRNLRIIDAVGRAISRIWPLQLANWSMPTMNIQLTTIARRTGLVLATVVTLLLAVDALASHKTTTGDAPAQESDTMQGGMMGGEMMMPGAQGLMMPTMDPVRGRELFASKGCVTCHSINGVGGEDATPLDAHTMQSMMNPFDFAAKMWRMAPAMIAAQEEALGEQIEFHRTGARRHHRLRPPRRRAAPLFRIRHPARDHAVDASRAQRSGRRRRSARRRVGAHARGG